MRIAYVCTDFGVPVFGTKGASVHVRELARAFEELGHDVLILAPRAGGPRPSGFGVRVERIEPDDADESAYRLLLADAAAGRGVAREVRSLLYRSTFRRRALETLRSFRPDVVYERHSLLGRAGLELARALGVPLVLEVNAPLADEQARHRGLAFKDAARQIEREVLSTADRVVVVSTALRGWLIELGIDAKHIAVVPNGVDTRRFETAVGARDAVRAQLGARDEALVGFVGSLKQWHDVSGLIDALVRVRGRGRAASLVVVGDGPQRVILAGRARAAGLDSVFTGAIPHERVPEHLAALDVAVAPYTRIDGFYYSPLKLVEYLAAAVPVVAADVGDLHHCVRPGETGWLYPPGNVAALAATICTVLDDRARAEALARAGREHVRAEHSWHANARKAVELASAARGDR
jgi:glycosyltransferase involved in cell wall biosynthesis